MNLQPECNTDIHPGLRRFLPKPPTNLDLARHQLAAAFHNFREATKRPDAPFLSWSELSAEQQAFYTAYAIPAAVASIWRGR